MNKEVEKIIVDILVNELDLPETYNNGIPSVVIGSQNFPLGNVEDLQIVVSNVDTTIISNKNELEVSNADDTTPGTERQTISAIETIQIDMFSKDNSARQRRVEVLMALQSYYSKEMQEMYQFKIFKIPSTFINTTSAEGGSQLNRFTINFLCSTWYEKIKNFSDYYEKFPARVDNENTINKDDGMLEFEIDENTNL